MAFSEITKEQFDALSLPESCRELWPRTHETEWYSDEAGTTLGILLADRLTGYFGYVICAQVNGEFARVGIGADFLSIAFARKDLQASMARHLEAHPN